VLQDDWQQSCTLMVRICRAQQLHTCATSETSAESE
jgi:hypothetical protein